MHIYFSYEDHSALGKTWEVIISAVLFAEIQNVIPDIKEQSVVVQGQFEKEFSRTSLFFSTHSLHINVVFSNCKKLETINNKFPGESSKNA